MFIFFFNDTATTEIYTLSLHDALPIFRLERAVPAVARSRPRPRAARRGATGRVLQERRVLRHVRAEVLLDAHHARDRAEGGAAGAAEADTRGRTGGLTDLCHRPVALRPGR